MNLEVRHVRLLCGRPVDSNLPLSSQVTGLRAMALLVKEGEVSALAGRTSKKGQS